MNEEKNIHNSPAVQNQDQGRGRTKRHYSLNNATKQLKGEMGMHYQRKEMDVQMFVPEMNVQNIQHLDRSVKRQTSDLFKTRCFSFSSLPSFILSPSCLKAPLGFFLLSVNIEETAAVTQILI
ncbi:hypothetical protein CHARACLAT_025345 [Characodon lateralis]|uniref:Uncharacterized protein n=1 Tax=Characodon lateralis TaxID=208331 RepID=A0ABU7D9V0_9TELE|nr:hypothetical protein [Characodon lateralis]